MCYVCNVYFSGKIFTNLKRTHKYVNKVKVNFCTENVQLCTI